MVEVLRLELFERRAEADEIRSFVIFSRVFPRYKTHLPKT